MGPAVLRIKDPQKIQASWKQYAPSKSTFWDVKLLLDEIYVTHLQYFSLT